MEHSQDQRLGYELSTSTARMDVDAIHSYLSRSYWAAGIPRDIVAKSLVGSVCFGIFAEGAQVAFARVITDGATFGYLSDLYVLEAHRGRGLANWLMEAVTREPLLQGLRRFVLATRDAHGLYQKFGFTPLARPEFFMEVHKPGIYSEQGPQ